MAQLENIQRQKLSEDNQQGTSTETLSNLIEKSRQDKRFDHAELDQVLAKYEAEKSNLNEKFSVKIGEEKSKADALLADSFEDVFEEYKLTNKADFDRVQHLLNIINPIRFERGQIMVFFSADTKAYFESAQSSDKNITLDKETGQLKLQSWYRGFFTREGSAKVDTDSKTLDPKEILLLEKMEKSPNAFLRGSVNDYYAFLSEGIEKTPVLENLSDLKVLSTGDLHLEQLEFIKGVPQISDIDDAIKDGSPTTDIVRAISSIRLLSTPDKADANVQAFLDTLQASLGGENPTSGEVPKKMQNHESSANFMEGKFIRFNIQTKKFTLDPDQGETSLNSEIRSEVQKLLPGLDIIDAKMASGQGIGSFGKEKITIAYKEGSDMKFSELKEQNSDSHFDRFFDKHENSERALVATPLGVTIKSVEIGGKPYTMKELKPGFAPFDTKEPGNIEFGSKVLAIQLGKLLNSDPEVAKKVLEELKKPTVEAVLKKLGTDYTTRISGAIQNARTEYPELEPQPLQKIDPVVSVAAEVNNLPTLTEGLSDSREVTETDITNLRKFYTDHPKGIPQFHREIQKDPEALSALKKILGLLDIATIQDVHNKTYVIQKTLGVTSDGAFGPSSFEKWKQNRGPKPSSSNT